MARAKRELLLANALARYNFGQQAIGGSPEGSQ